MNQHGQSEIPESRRWKRVRSVPQPVATRRIKLDIRVRAPRMKRMREFEYPNQKKIPNCNEVLGNVKDVLKCGSRTALVILDIAYTLCKKALHCPYDMSVRELILKSPQTLSSSACITLSLLGFRIRETDTELSIVLPMYSPSQLDTFASELLTSSVVLLRSLYPSNFKPTLEWCTLLHLYTHGSLKKGRQRVPIKNQKMRRMLSAHEGILPLFLSAGVKVLSTDQGYNEIDTNLITEESVLELNSNSSRLLGALSRLTVSASSISFTCLLVSGERLLHSDVSVLSPDVICIPSCHLRDVLAFQENQRKFPTGKQYSRFFSGTREFGMCILVGSAFTYPKEVLNEKYYCESEQKTYHLVATRLRVGIPPLTVGDIPDEITRELYPSSSLLQYGYFPCPLGFGEPSFSLQVTNGVNERCNVHHRTVGDMVYSEVSVLGV